ncbi:MAG: hypothetical protein M9949_07280 [Candidatus Kapabacteria bacterium]|nr:hypothetical protein [Candidatus Kapabacteria bacterium]
MHHFKYLISALALVAFLFVSCSDNSSSPALTEDFTGFVKNSEDQAIENANIEIFGLEDKLIASDITDKDGKFTLTSIPIKKEGLTYRVRHAEYATISGDFETFYNAHKSEAGKSPVVFKLLQEDSCCGDMTVQVLDYESGDPLENVEVKISRGNEWSEKKYTDGEGVQNFGALCAGKHWLRFALEGYQVVEDYFEIVECDTLNLTIKMKIKDADECCNNILNFVVTDKDGNAISNAKVNLYRDGKLVKDDKTNEDGKLTYSELCKGKYTFAILKDSYKGIEGYQIFDCEENVTVNKTLSKEENLECCDNTLNFIISDENGNAIKDAKIILYRNGKAVHDGKTDDNGKITFAELCKGKYTYAIQKDTYKGVEGYQIFDCKENITVEKTLYKGNNEACCDNKLTIFVGDDANNPLANATVLLYRDGKVAKEGKTGNDGYVYFAELCKGKYSILIKSEGFKPFEFHHTFGCEEDIKYNKTLVKDQGEDCCGVLKLTVIDKTTNTPIANAEVKITRADNKFYDIKKSGNDGSVEFTKLCMSKYWVRVAAENYKVVEDYVYIENCDKAVEKTIKLESKNNTECCDNTINFIVKDADGNPLSGVKIKLIKDNTVKKTLETQNGTASTGKIMCKGSYKVVMMKEGYQTIEFQTSVNCNEDITIDKKLEGGKCCDAQIKIAVKDADSEESLNGAKVRLWKDGKVEREGTVENGYVWFKELCEGKYGVDIMYEGYNGMEFQYEISCKNDNYLVKKLSKK